MDPEIIGYIAAVLTTAAYVPQTVKVFKHRDTRSISKGMYCLLTTGIAFWVAYGVLIGSPSVILANGITFIMAMAIMIMKFKLD